MAARLHRSKSWQTGHPLPPSRHLRRAVSRAGGSASRQAAADSSAAGLPLTNADQPSSRGLTFPSECRFRTQAAADAEPLVSAPARMRSRPARRHAPARRNPPARAGDDTSVTANELLSTTTNPATSRACDAADKCVHIRVHRALLGPESPVVYGRLSVLTRGLTIRVSGVRVPLRHRCLQVWKSLHTKFSAAGVMVRVWRVRARPPDSRSVVALSARVAPRAQQLVSGGAWGRRRVWGQCRELGGRLASAMPRRRSDKR